MKYNTRIHAPAPRAITNPGRKEKDTYILEIAPNGDKKLIKNGSMDINAEIQSHVAMCDVKNIIERFSLSGEVDRLKASPGFVDLTNMPSNLAETYALIKHSKKLYEDLNPDMKKNFASYEDFLANFANASTAAAFLQKYAVKPEIVEEREVVVNEQSSDT